MTFNNFASTAWTLVVSTLISTLIIPDSAIGQTSPYNANYRLVVPAAAPGSSVVIDGTVLPNGSPESFWNSAAKFDLDLGTNSPAAQLWAVKDSANLYLYFEIEADDFYFKDVLVLAIGPNPSGGDYRRLHIFPCGPNPEQGSCPSAAVDNHETRNEYWTTASLSNGSVTWPPAKTALPSGFEVKSGFAIGGSKKWSVELKMPIADFSLPTTGFFGLYVDLADVTSQTGDATQYPWPPKFTRPPAAAESNIIGGAPGEIVSQLQNGTPPPERWGMATLDATNFAGVYVSDVRTNHSASPTLISTIGPNQFYATARNVGYPNQPLVDARQVSAQFSISGWGAGNVWQQLPPGGGSLTNPNPTSPVTVPATGSYQFEVGPWTLTQAEAANYASPKDHQCIRVELTSTDPSTVIMNPVLQQNMDFVQTQSPFRRKATVGTADLGFKDGTAPTELVLRERFFNTPADDRWDSRIKLESTAGRYVIKTHKEKRSESFDVVVQPPKVKIPRKIVKVAANSAKATEIRVTPGNLITLFAKGSVVMRKGLGKASLVGPGGRNFTVDRKLFAAMFPRAPHLDQKGMSKGERFLLGQKDVPAAAIGALIGSWDSFKTSSFIVGEASTLKVPKKAEVLSLAINDVPNAESKRFGEGFTIDVVQTLPRPHFAATNPIVMQDATNDSFRLPPGSNLPTWIMRVSAKTGKVLVIDGETFDALEPVGAFGAIVNRIGP